jgi:hypothetical protein
LRGESGQVLILAAAALPLVAFLAALVIDGSNLFVQKRSLQNAADAAALAAAQDLSTSACGAPCANAAGKYAGLNNSNPDPAGPTSQTPLPACTAVVTTNCYVNPYLGDPTKIEVRLTRHVPTLFGKIFGLSNDVTRRSVAVIAPGKAPQITFAALNQQAGCDHHTLVIRSSGTLVVNNNIYVNSCSGTPGNGKGDGFDVFGPGGSISAKDIFVHGGWETHDGDLVFIPVGGTQCPYLTATTTAPPWQPGCPHTGQPLLVDPFAGKLLPPPLGPPIGSTCSALTPCYTLAEYSPRTFVDDGDGSIDATQVSFLAHGRSIANGDYISVDGERMKVSGTNNVNTSPPAPNGETITTGTAAAPLRGQLGTLASAHTAPAAIAITGKLCINDEAILTTASPHHLEMGDWFKVSGVGVGFDGIYELTGIPDDESSGAKQVKYTGSCGNVGAWPVTKMMRISGVSTLASSTTLAAGDHPLIVDLTGSDTTFNVEGEDDVAAQSPTTGTKVTYNQPGLPDVHGDPLDIQTVQRFEGTVTIRTAQNHNLDVGDFVQVSNSPGDTSLDGHVQVTKVPANNKFEYAQSGPDIQPDDLNSNNIQKVQRLGGTSTITTGGIPAGFAADQYVVVHISTSAYTSFSGKFLITGVNTGAKTFSYDQTGLPNVNPAANAAGTYDNLTPVASFSRTGDVATIVTTVAHGLPNGASDVLVDLTSDNSFSGTFNVTKVNTTTFTYPNPGRNVSGTGVAADGITKIHAPGGSVDETGDGATATPDYKLTTGTIAGPPVDITGGGGTLIGSLFEIFKVTNPTSPSTGTTAAAPAEYALPAGGTLDPATYYGGICIGAPLGAHCGAKVGGTCAPSTGPPRTVIMNPGVYIMAGGGFHVCGNTTLQASSGVMIYNTIDSAASPLAAASLGQVKFNTNGDVFLHSIRDTAATPYTGLVIWQGQDPAAAIPSPNLQMSTGACDGRALNSTDIVLQHTGNGLNGFQGTIYAPAQYALFRDTVSGIATLAVITGCIFIDGANSTFNFDDGSGGDPLHGSSDALSE